MFFSLWNTIRFSQIEVMQFMIILFQTIMTWMPLAEQNLDDMETPSSHPQTLKSQIEELKVKHLTYLVCYLLHE